MSNRMNVENENLNHRVRVEIKEIGPVGPQGPQGPQGPKGDKGDSGNATPYISLRRLGEYIYEVTFDDIPEYVPSNDFVPAGCTSFVRDGKLYTNLDWKYAKTADFKINFKDVEGLTFIDNLNDSALEGKEDIIGQLPYKIRDGHNSKGLMVTTHVLFNDFSYTGSGSKNVDLTLLPYYVLSTMSKVNEMSEEVVNLINNTKVNTGEYLIQVLVTDGETTMLFTPSELGYDYIDISSNPKLTNFKWVNRATVDRTDEDIQERPSGIERWNLIGLNTKLSDLKFTLAYESNGRLSEFIGIDETTKDSTDEELQAIYERAHAEYLIRQRNGVLWQTVHSAVYSNYNMETLYAQEDYNKNYIFVPVEVDVPIPTASDSKKILGIDDNGNYKLITIEELKTLLEI